MTGMANEEMAKPTAEQSATLNDTLQALIEASSKASDIARSIGRLRDKLNDARFMLCAVKKAIGPDAYRYNSRETWHSSIDAAIAEIEKALK